MKKFLSFTLALALSVILGHAVQKNLPVKNHQRKKLLHMNLNSVL